MDGVHDLGGTDGTGPIQYRASGPPFHADWERTVFATVLITMAQGAYAMDAFRHAIERMDPAWYLSSPYFEHWLAGAEKLLVEEEVVDPGELTARIEAAEAGDIAIPEREDPDLVETMRSIIDAGGSPRRGDGEPSFAVGDRVRVRNMHPEGHTRCPGYVRRVEGEVREVRGAHALPDAGARGEDRAEPLYSVRFSGDELWGPDAEANTTVSVDLWESYLARVDDSGSSGDHSAGGG